MYDVPRDDTSPRKRTPMARVHRLFVAVVLIATGTGLWFLLSVHEKARTFTTPNVKLALKSELRHSNILPVTQRYFSNLSGSRTPPKIEYTAVSTKSAPSQVRFFSDDISNRSKLRLVERRFRNIETNEGRSAKSKKPTLNPVRYNPKSNKEDRLYWASQGGEQLVPRDRNDERPQRYVRNGLPRNSTRKNKGLKYANHINKENMDNDTLSNVIRRSRQRICNKCFQPNISYLLNPQDLCKKTDENILVLVMVFTEHRHFSARQKIRETWGSVSSKNTGIVRVVFVLGYRKDTDATPKLRKESRAHEDILQGNFTDSFRNLTLKTIMSLGWAQEYCQHAKYLFKTDDDMWVNIPKFLQLAPQYPLEDAIAGTCFPDQWAPQRDPKNKYYASFEEYPDPLYPALCVGTAYAMTLSTARDIYRVSPDIPFFHLEDVYIALCRTHLGYDIIPLPGFRNNKETFSVCYYRTKLVTSHWVSESEMVEAWTKGCFTESVDPISDFVSKYMQAAI